MREKKEDKTHFHPLTVKDCNFEANINFDTTTMQTITTVAQALLNLTELFKSQNIKIESLLRIDQAKKE